MGGSGSVVTECRHVGGMGSGGVMLGRDVGGVLRDV